MSTREVTLDGGSPWGFRMHGGADTQQPLRIARVNPGSKAAQRGIREGDLISSINGQSTRGITNSEAHALLRNAGDTLVLGLNQETTGSPKRRAQKISQDSKEEILKRTSITSTSSTLSNITTINRTISNSQQSNETTHTNGVGDHKESEEKIETTNNFQSYIKNGTPYTTPRGAIDDGQSRDVPDDDTARNHSTIRYNESSDAGDDESVITAARDKALLAAAIMADNVCGSSRSRNKRRSRNNRKRSKKCNLVTQQDSNETNTNASEETIHENSVNNTSLPQTINSNHNEISNSETISATNNMTANNATISVNKNCDSNNEHVLKTETVTDESVNSATKSLSKKLDSVMVMVSPDSDICIVEFPKTKSKNCASVSISEISDNEENNSKTDNISTETVTINDVITENKRSEKKELTSETIITSPASNSEKRNVIKSSEKTCKNIKVCDEIDFYQVEFPKPVLERKNSNNGMVKSRSLDDDEQLKITELTDDEKSTSCMSESQAIVSEASEAESDVEWETTAELAMKKESSGQQFGKLSIISLPLEEHVTYETSHISPEDERSLRDFLEGLDLVNSPEESVQRIEKTSTPNTETVKMKRAKKRAALAQHFLPYYQNPRYLDVISEEGSDLSDRDNKPSTSYRCQLVDTDDDDDVFEDIQLKLRNKFQSHYAGTNEGAILVGTKLINPENTEMKEAIWSTSMTDTPSGAEVVYLEDSSNSMTPSDLLDQDETTADMDADDEEDISLDFDKTCSESLEIDQNSLETSSIIKSDNAVTLSSDTASRVSPAVGDEQIKSETAHQPTPPPTSDTPANDIVEEAKPSNKKTIDFLDRILAIVSNNTSADDILITLNNDEFHNLPADIKSKLKTRALEGDHNKMINEIKVLQNSIKDQSIETENCSENDELNKELKNLCDCLNKPTDEYSSQIDSTPNVSRSDSAASSRSTSQCTALYNPLHSSLTNIAAMLREGSFDDRVARSEPAPLREICIRALLAMPFGKDVIEELADVSLSIEEMTCQTPSRIHPTDSIHNKSPSPQPPPVPPRNNKPNTDASSVLLVDNPVVQTPSQPVDVEMERWIGMPSEENPNLLVCLSPSQKEFIDKTKTFPNEADSLLDLHRKYIERRGYHEESERKVPTTVKKDIPTVPAFKIKFEPQNIDQNENNLLKIIHNSGMDSANNNTMNPACNYNNYVKQFTREIPIKILKSNDSNKELNANSGNIRYDKYIKQLTREVPIQVEKQINKPVNNKIYSAALSNENTCSGSSRLKARHLGEWLNLARNECDRINNTTEHIREVHNLHSSVNKLVSQRSCEDRFLHSSDEIYRRGTSPRRYSLPFNLYEQQMQYILEKEREIEQEIEKLKKEKSQLENDEKSKHKYTTIPVQQEINAHNTTVSKVQLDKTQTSNVQNKTEEKQKIETTNLFKELHISQNHPVNNKQIEKMSGTKTKEHIIPIHTENKSPPKQNSNLSSNSNKKPNIDFNIPEFTSHIEEKSKFESNEKFTISYQKDTHKKESTKYDTVVKSNEHIIPIHKEFTTQNQTKFDTIKSKKEHIIPVHKESDNNNTKKTHIEHVIPIRKETMTPAIQKPKYENTELFRELHITSRPKEVHEKCKHEEHIIPIHKEFDAGKYQISRKGDIAILNSDEKLMPKLSQASTVSEKFREEMYNEYMCKIAERQERKQNKVIKVQISPKTKEEEKSSVINSQYEVKQVTGIGDEFMNKVREKKGKLGVDESDNDEENNLDNAEVPPVKIIDGTSVTDAKQLPKHLKEFIDYTTTSTTDDGVWSPGKNTDTTPSVISQDTTDKRASPPKDLKCDEPAPVVWTPRSAGSSPTADRKEFRPVNFESPTLSRKNKSKESTPVTTPETSNPIAPPWEGAQRTENVQEVTSLSSTLERKLTTSHSAPVAGLNNLGKLPRAQNPTITLLQKAREGQLPRGASYIEDPQQNSQKPRNKDGRPPLIGPGEILYTVKNEYLSESDSEKPKKMADLGPRKFEGIGPTTKDGMPIVLRSEVKDSNQAKWYKRMYDTLHRARNDDEYVTVRYKTRRGRYPYTSAAGYLSEPEPNAYDSDAGISASKYATLDRRRLQTNKDKENEYITYTVPRNKYMSSASVKHSTDIYKNQPGRIENYVPGHSSISEKEAKEHLEQQKHVPPAKSYMSHALKESGYESDSTLVFRRREDAALQLSPHEQKEAYKSIQKGGEVPLHGLRKPAPERPKEPDMGPTPPPKGQPIYRDIGPESPRKYVEDEVTIHYRSPVRHEIKEAISEEELARRQAEAMRRIYQEERRRKYLQELQDMNSRRHTDNFIPSQKSPIPLNRYDDFIDDLSPKIKLRDRSPEPRLVARALYNFVGQSSRELTFRKGDIIFIRRQVDKNWYEGEHNAMIGLFPSNYVEIIPYDGIKSTPRKANEGQARAKFNFIAQTHLELSLAKGELVVLTRRVDDNWFEGRIGNRKGIFPVSYVEILIDPSEKQEITLSSSKPVASPAAHSLLLNGSAGGKESMGSHHYQPSYSTQNTATSYHAKPVNVIGNTTSYQSITRTQKITTAPAVNEALHIDTHHTEPVPYRALYKYRPQNDDELELQEGDTVYVLEKCDDGWYVGSSQRTGAFGTFPGNYVERI